MTKSAPAPRSATSSANSYCPDEGDVVWISLDPQAGSEHAGRRPALVLSPQKYNQLSRLCVLCPITSQLKPYSFVTPIPEGACVTGAVLADQVKSLSWLARRAELIGIMPQSVVDDVKAKIKALLRL